MINENSLKNLRPAKKGNKLAVKPASEKKTKCIQLPVTEAEHERITKESEELGYKAVTTMLRELLGL